MQAIRRNNMERYQFIFQGSESQFSLFREVVNEKIKYSDLKIDFILPQEEEVHCSIIRNDDYIFEMGMLLATVYHKIHDIDLLDNLEWG